MAEIGGKQIHASPTSIPLSSPTPFPTPQISQPQSETQPQSHSQIKYPLWFGGSASCIAVAVSHPLDLIKVRMQMASAESKGAALGAKTGTVGAAMRIIRGEGVRGLYAGFSAGFMRQLTYGTTRIATYETLKSHLPPTQTNPLTLTLAATLSGILGAIPGNASDLANTRMQNDSSLPPHLRRNYTHVLDAWRQMYRSEGIWWFTRGMGPNCARCGAMTACQLGSYDYFKTLLLDSPLKVNFGVGDGVVQGLSSVMAAFVATSVCSPADVVKTRLMGISSGGGGKGGGSVVGVVAELMRREGLNWVVRGWVPSFIRLGPQTVVTLVMLEEHKRLYRKMYGRN